MRGAEKEKADQYCKAGLRLAVRVLIGLSVQGPVLRSEPLPPVSY
jgi:hypothetical protein